MNEYMKLLGMKVEDRVTGFKGVVSSLCFDLYGCVQAAVSPAAGADGKLEDGRWFDAKRLKVTSKTPVMAAPVFANLPAGHENGPAEKPAINTRVAR